MYSDSKRVRRRYCGVNLDEYEAKLIDAMVEFSGVERATLIRQLVLREACEVLGLSDVHAPMVRERMG